jgi:hypothetical protein
MNMTPAELREALDRNPALHCRDLDKLPEEPKGVILHKVSAGGWRDDLDRYFRSSWEANYARYLNFIKEPWEYEPKEFEFPVKRGNRTYKPDFYLPRLDRWVEVKGYMDQKSKVKLNRFKKYFPEEFAKLEIVDGEKYSEIKKYAGLIPGWEVVGE